jgi:hypothetical protein
VSVECVGAVAGPEVKGNGDRASRGEALSPTFEKPRKERAYVMEWPHLV